MWWLTVTGWFAKPVGKAFGAVFGTWFKGYVKHRMTLPETIKRTHAMLALMAELRVLTDADRVAVFQFHNGGYFSNRNPQWRISCTDEQHAPGVIPAGWDTQAIFASRMIDVVGHLFDGGTPAHACREKIGGRDVYQIDVGTMPNSYAKMILANQGVSAFVQIPLYDSEDSIPFGYLALDYCNFGHPNVDPDFAPKLGRIVEYADKIEFLLVNRKGTLKE